MSEKRKIQHYIPQFYLREFTSNAQKRSQVYCFDKKSGKAFLASTNKIGAESYFYDVGENQDVEVGFSELESKMSSAYQNLLSSKDIRKLSTDDRVGLAVLIATQHMRTRSFRNTIKDATNFVLQNAKNLADSQNQQIVELLKEIAKEEDSAKRFQYTLMGRSIRDFSTLLLQMKWILFVNETNKPFWSSDNPFTYSNIFQYDKNDGLGFERPGSQTHFPLSPKISLEIVDPKVYFEYPDILYIDDEDNIIFNNHLQVKNAHRYIFASNSDFSIAEEMIRNAPKLRETHRNRFEGV